MMYLNLKLFSSIEALEEKRKRIEQAKYEAGMKCRIEIQDDTIVEVNEDAQLHFVKFETRQIEKCLDYIRDTLMMSEHFTQVNVNRKRRRDKQKMRRRTIKKIEIKSNCT